MLRPEDVVGGVMATLLGDDIRKETGVTVMPGLLDKPGILDKGSPIIVDGLIPDYQILESIDDAYIAYAIHGCPNRCQFCAVHKIDPCFCHYLPIQRQVKGIEDVYGCKQDLNLMDNNVLASRFFKLIINDICALEFEKGAKLGDRMRRVDFNQGVDARKLSEKKIALLADTAIRPLRIAFDHISMKDMYVSRIRLAKIPPTTIRDKSPRTMFLEKNRIDRNFPIV